MRALIQRVTSASVSVDGAVIGEVGAGLLALIGIHRDDTVEDGDWLIRKLLSVRIFEDDAGKMGRSVADINGAISGRLAIHAVRRIEQRHAPEF